MTDTIVFIHGGFQNAKSWGGWVSYFGTRGYGCVAESWPQHEGEPAALRRDPPAGLGDLRLRAVVEHYAELIGSKRSRPVAIGQGAGGLVVQKLAEMGLIDAGVAVAPFAPNRAPPAGRGFFHGSVSITDPIAGDDVCVMTPEGFHETFANTMTREDSDRAYMETAAPESRRLVRDCVLGAVGVDLGRPHVPLLFVVGREDRVCPPALCGENAGAYSDAGSVTVYREFPRRGHLICREPGWEEVVSLVADWLSARRAAVTR
jgi:pimeloyl-ACP methyl ester carboxylesterase